MNITVILQQIVDFVWGLPLVIFLFTANFYLLWLSRFLPLKGVIHATKLLRHKDEKAEEGQIPHFQTFCNAIAATVGLGNISGVAIAIAQGGPGVILWMWIAAIIGMNTKFFECTAALIYRARDYRGHWQGGAMYTIPQILHKKWSFLAWLFAGCGMIGTLSMFQINQLSSFGAKSYNIPNWLSGLFFSIITLWVLRGGLKRLSSVCSAIVPFMSVIYVSVCLVILSLHIKLIPTLLVDIVTHAFTAQSALYGTLSYGLIHIMVTGIKRATFSNEAGLGTAPMAHSNSSSPEPVAEGYVAMLGPLLDTLVICTLTALVILVNFVGTDIPKLSGIELTTLAFEMNLGVWGKHFLGISILLFAYSTMLGMANYNQKCWDFIFRGKAFLGQNSFQFWYVGTILVGSVLAAENVVNLIDIAYALMTIPNIVATVVVAPRVKAALDNYNQRHKI